MAGEPPAQKQVTASPLGDCPLDIAEVRTEAGTLALCVARDRPGTLADAERHAEAHTMLAAQFLQQLLAARPSKIHPGLTDHGLHLTHRTRDLYAFDPIVERVCRERHSAHRLTKPTPPWTHGPGERMTRTLTEATVQNDDDQSHQHLKAPLQAVWMASNLAQRRKTLSGLTPYDYIGQSWQQEPEHLTINPYQHTLGLNT